MLRASAVITGGDIMKSSLRQCAVGVAIGLMVGMIRRRPNNWPGQFGIEIEPTTKLSVRNIWVKKLR
jgi:hypothetical protein